MRQKSMSTKSPAERAVRDIRRKTRKQYSAEEKIRIVLEGLRGEESIAAAPVGYGTASRTMSANKSWKWPWTSRNCRRVNWP